MIEVVTVGALVLAWFTFRYDRHRRWRAAIDAAYGSLRAVHHGMVQGLTADQAVGWGQLYFLNGYTEEAAQERARETYRAVRARVIDEVFVVPTEPLAKLATATPRDDLLAYKAIAAANFALWRVHVFNQLVLQLADFNTVHLAEIASEDTDDRRRENLAEAAAGLSWFVHWQGIGLSWAQEDGSRGWYGALVDAIGENMRDLHAERSRHRRHWFLQLVIVVDALAVGILVGAIVAAFV